MPRERPGGATDEFFRKRLRFSSQRLPAWQMLRYANRMFFPENSDLKPVQEPPGMASPDRPFPESWFDGQWLDSDRWILTAAVAVAVGLVLAVIVSYVLGRLRRRPPAETPDPALKEIGIASLQAGGPGDTFPRLEIYGTPVRLAVVVLAPVGRQGHVPPAELLPMVWECLVPGLSSLVERDKPLVRFWPAQLSTQGFAQLFFHHLGLPGDRGRGTPWCGVAGKVDWGGKSYLVGIAARGDGPNGLAAISMQHQGQWLDAVRIRKSV